MSAYHAAGLELPAVLRWVSPPKHLIYRAIALMYFHPH